MSRTIGETYIKQKIEVSPILTVEFPVEKMIDEYINNIYSTNLDIANMKRNIVYKTLYTDFKIPDYDNPGLAALTETAIKTIVQIIGSFAQNVLVITQLVDKLKLAAIAPTNPENVKIIADITEKFNAIIKDITEFLSNAGDWVLKKILAPISEIKIPIPEIKIPLLGMELKIPKIDITGKMSEIESANKSKDQKASVDMFSKSIASTMIQIITMPVNIIVGLFKALIDAITGMLSFDFSKFTTFLEMMKPTLPSIRLLFITVVDGMIPGLSGLYNALNVEFPNFKRKDGDLRTGNVIEDIIKFIQKNGDTYIPNSATVLGQIILAFKIILFTPDLLLTIIIELFNLALAPLNIVIPKPS